MISNSPENEVVYARVNAHQFQWKFYGQNVLYQKALNIQRTTLAKVTWKEIPED